MDNQEKAFAERLQQWEKEFREGNHVRCLEAIWICLQFDRPVPQWAFEHFIASMWRYKSAEAWTLDDAFRVQRPKGQKKARVRQRYTRGLRAHMKAHALHDAKGYTVENAIAEVASQLSMSDADAERWYYDSALMKELRYPQKSRRKRKKTGDD